MERKGRTLLLAAWIAASVSSIVALNALYAGLSQTMLAIGLIASTVGVGSAGALLARSPFISNAPLPHHAAFATNVLFVFVFLMRSGVWLK
jgi:hypothetical protein